MAESSAQKSGQWIALSLCLFAGSGAFAGVPGTGASPLYRSDRVIVVPRADVTPADWEAWNQSHRVSTARGYARSRSVTVVQTRPGSGVEEMIQEYRASGLVEIAEPDYLLRACDTPNDPAYVDGTAWALRNEGQNGGQAGAEIKVAPVWPRLSASAPVIVAVVDSGIRYTHADLAANMWVNPGEIAGNGIDDDGDGVIDDVHGINAMTGSGDPIDAVGHGTHVAGIIGALANNRQGSLGVARNVRLMALRFMDANGEGSTSDAIECIDYARIHGAKVINASWGGPALSQALRRAIDRARAAGIIFVAAAANDGSNNDLHPVYPASYGLANMVVVAATDRQDQLASFSNYGATSVDLAAPGVDIYSSWNTGDDAYFVASGTSMATPFVTGTFALLAAQFPDKSYVELIDAVLGGVDPVGSLAGKTVTGGRLNVQGAFALLGPPVSASLSLERSSEVTATVVSLRLAGSPAQTYIVEQSADLENWTALQTGATDRGGNLVLQLSPADGVVRFFRARVQP